MMGYQIRKQALTVNYHRPDLDIIVLLFASHTSAHPHGKQIALP
jgi:hypothetical protein